ncbi:RNA polymerase sigma factor [Stieleria tagensis]|uniref:RNA polymerase sigma factor n=1 Tax=Stieleria tagensis TaxID=2956795 RepID=UPI00209A7A4B|nr:sigma-70 family RNA polymerase sigma factor [Stieleria tagensis]
MEKSLTEPEFAGAVSDAMPQLVAVARRLAGDDELAAEAVQNALLRASKSWRRFRGGAHVNTWLTKIVIHCVRDAISAQRRRTDRNHHYTSSPDDDGLSQQIEDPRRGPSQQALDRECRIAIQTAVRALPDRQREVFSLMVWQGMSARQVGQLLEINPQTVHANLHAARCRLRTILDPYVNDNRDANP